LAVTELAKPHMGWRWQVVARELASAGVTVAPVSGVAFKSGEPWIGLFRLTASPAFLERARLRKSQASRHRAALALQMGGDCANAVQELTRLLARAPVAARPSIYSDRAVCQQALGRPEAAVEDLRKALAQDPGHAAAALSLGALHLGSARPDLAKAVYSRAYAASASVGGPLRERLALALKELEKK
jgi:tetratricopeptide (TPR) repeat protein